MKLYKLTNDKVLQKIDSLVLIQKELSKIQALKNNYDHVVMGSKHEYLSTFDFVKKLILNVIENEIETIRGDK
jgi:hypothetical protein